MNYELKKYALCIMNYALKKICIMHYELCIKIVNLRKILK